MSRREETPMQLVARVKAKVAAEGKAARKAAAARREAAEVVRLTAEIASMPSVDPRRLKDKIRDARVAVETAAREESAASKTKAKTEKCECGATKDPRSWFCASCGTASEPGRLDPSGDEDGDGDESEEEEAKATVHVDRQGGMGMTVERPRRIPSVRAMTVANPWTNAAPTKARTR
jgi:hypothetical protein